MVTGRPGEIVLDSNRYKLQDPKRWQKQPVVRAARKIGGGDTQYSDYDLWNVKAWDTWHLGRGEEYFETDGRYHDSWNCETRIRKQITLGPRIHFTGVGETLHYEAGTFGPVSIGNLAASKTKWAESFVAPTGDYTADLARVYLRKSGAPVVGVTVEIYTDDGGTPNLPNTLVAGATATVAATSIDTWLYTWYSFDWTGTVTLTAASTYWLVISTTDAVANAGYEIGADSDAGYSGDCAYYSDSSWADDTANRDLWFQLEGAEGELSGEPVKFAYFYDSPGWRFFCLAGSKVYYWHTDNHCWTDDSAGLTGVGTDMQVFDDCLVVAQGTFANLRKKQSGSWGNLTDGEEGRKLGLGICPAGGDAGKTVLIKSGPDARTDRHKVRCIAAIGDTWQSLKSSDGSDTVVGDASADITWIGQYQGSIWFGKEDGVYEVGKDGMAYCKFPFFTQMTTWNFGGSSVWHRNELILPAMYGLWSFDGKSLKNIGPGVSMQYEPAWSGVKGGQSVGLASTRQGVVYDTLPTVNVLYAAVDAGNDSARFSSVLQWTGRGWHEIARGDSINKQIWALGYSPASTIETDARLWYGYDKNVCYLSVPDTTDDAFQWASADFQGEGYVDFGWFDAGLKAVDKDWRDITIEAENITAGRTVHVQYRLDDDTPWASLGLVDDGTVGTAISSNQATLSFGTDTYGRRIQIRVRLATNTESESPKVTGVILKYWKVPDPIYGWNFTLKLTELDRSWRTQQSDFKTTYEKKEPVTLVDPYGASHTVRLDNLAETIVASETGEPLGCLITVRAVEA